MTAREPNSFRPLNLPESPVFRAASMIASRLRNRKPARIASFVLGVASSALMLLASPRTAKADTHDELGHYERWRRSSESEQDVAIELRFGRYVPNADEGLNGTPYKNIFGDKNRYFVGAEVDWQLLRIPMLGTLAPGLGAGYTIAGARARFTDGSGLSKQETSLAILPMYLVGVLRADVVARETLVPLVPYAKLGLGYALWWSKDQEDTARVDGKLGRGRSYGYQFALGAMFLLDVIDRADAKAADASIGLNHSYLFAEWFKSDLDGFGSKDQLQVGTSSWALGLAMEF